MSRFVLAVLAALLLAGCSSLSSASHPRRVPPDYSGSYTTWWSDEVVREEGEYKQGRRHGHVRGYHPDGSLAFEGQFSDGVSVGQLVQNYPGGTRAIVEDVQPEKQQTQRAEYAPTGELRARGTITAGERHGVVEQFHPNGKVSSRGRFEHDAPAGEWESFDESGRLVARTVYFSAHGKPAGYLETVEDAEGHISVQTRMLIEGETFLGRVTLWYPNGRQAGLVEYRNGLREGRDVSWDAEGRKRSEGRRAADLREGVWTTWGESGAVESRTLFEHDRALGPAPADA